MKHGFVPLIGISRHLHQPTYEPYYSYRLSFYWFMLQICYYRIDLCYKGQLQYAIEWHKELKPKIAVKKGELLYYAKGELINRTIKYSWKRNV